MTIDERLEALTQNVELLTATVADHERKWERLRMALVAALKEWIEEPTNGGSS